MRQLCPCRRLTYDHYGKGSDDAALDELKQNLSILLLQALEVCYLGGKGSEVVTAVLRVALHPAL